MDNFDFLKEAVRKASEEQGIAEYELYYSEDESISAETYRDELSEFSSSVGALLLYRCIVNGKLGYASTESMTEDEMGKLVARAKENAAAIEKDEEAIIYAGAEPGAYGEVKRVPFTMPTAADIRRVVMNDRDILYRADPMVADGTCASAAAGRSTVRLFNSHGLDLSASVGSASEAMEAVLDDGNEKQFDYDYLFDRFDAPDEEREALAAEIAAGARGKFGAGSVKTGKYSIVFDRKQVRAILSTFLSVFYGENAQKGLSLLKGKVGEKIAADCVTITDDPFYEGNTMQFAFDGEGVPTRKKNVVENGVLKTLLYNLTSAKKDGVETTGNASRSASSIGTRVFSFYINPGTLSKEELLKKAGNGIYVNEMKGFHAGANAVTGDFSIESAGFLIEDGKLTRPVKSFTVAGNFFELLKSVSEIGSELEMGGPGITQIASPEILVPDMSVAGD